MVDVHEPARVSGSARAVWLFVMLFGIVAMHAGVYAIQCPAQDSALAGSGVVAMPAAGQHTDAVGAMTDRHTGGHGGMHACVFVLSVIALAIGLVLLYRSGAPSGCDPTPLSRLCRAHRARPPPWTTPSLAELSILRI
ncbi:DUF6153 family protein [Nocardia sp. NBC_01388]|uniref:DUF6153 family protein n=1 Tax=Nocardia sp. NBC_01388 TaxID=2903596 RepID=UPI00386A200C